MLETTHLLAGCLLLRLRRRHLHPCARTTQHVANSQGSRGKSAIVTGRACRLVCGGTEPVIFGLLATICNWIAATVDSQMRTATSRAAQRQRHLSTRHHRPKALTFHRQPRHPYRHLRAPRRRYQLSALTATQTALRSWPPTRARRICQIWATTRTNCCRMRVVEHVPATD